MSKWCRKGWDDEQYNQEGRCCCNCVFQRKLVKHPWNIDGFKGSISEQVTDSDGDGITVCLVFEQEAMSMKGSHGMCEMHTFKDKSE